MFQLSIKLPNPDWTKRLLPAIYPMVGMKKDGWTASYAAIAGIGPRRNVENDFHRELQWRILVDPFFDGTSTLASALEMYANVLVSDRYFDAPIQQSKEKGSVAGIYRNCANLRVYLGLRYASVATRLIENAANCGTPSEVTEDELQAMTNKHGLSIKALREQSVTAMIEEAEVPIGESSHQKDEEEKYRIERKQIAEGLVEELRSVQNSFSALEQSSANSSSS
jgi:hypothetical protein